MNTDAPRSAPRFSFGVLAFWLLMMSGLLAVANVKSAQAQATFTIEAVNPLNGDKTRQTISESDDPVFNVTLTNAVANTRYTVTVRTFDGNNADARRNAFGDSNIPTPDPRSGVAPTVAPNDSAPFYYPNDYFIKTQDLIFTGNGTQTFTVNVIDDKDYEAILPTDPVTFNQSFTVQIANVGITATGTGGGGTSSNINDTVRQYIIDNDQRPDIAVAPIRYDAYALSGTNAFRETNSGTSTNGVTVYLSARNEAEDINFNYSFSSGTTTTPATQGTDFNNTAGQAVFRRGETIATDPANAANSTPVALDIRGDVFDEPDEDVRVTLSGATTARVATVTGSVLILDDDAPIATVADVSVIEPDTGQTAQAVFTVNLNAASLQDINVLYTVDPIGADPAEELPVTNRGQDYVDPGSGTYVNVYIPAGTTSKTFSIPINGDLVDENDETFAVSLIRGANTRGIRFQDGAGNADNEAIGTIVDNDRPTFRLGTPLTINEPAGGQAVLNFPVTLDQPSERLLTIQASTQDGTATAPGDYDASSQTLSFSPGVGGDPTQPPVQSQVLQVNVNSDTIDEIDENFFVNLTNANVADALIAVGQTTGTIIDDDGPRIRIDDVTGTEGNSGTTPFVFTVSLRDSGGALTTSPQPITVAYRTQDGTATSTGVNADYADQTGTLTFPAGTSTQTITINVNGNTTRENAATENFQVILSAPTNADPTNPFIGVDATNDRALGIITEDDAIPTITINDPQVVEGIGAPFTISLSNPSENSITVDYTTAQATATDNVDYTRTQGSITFSPATIGVAAETSKTVLVPTLTDTIDEANETFTLDLTLAAGSTTFANFGTPVADSQGQATILDDDGPQLVIDPATANESAGTLNFTVRLVSPVQVGPPALAANTSAQDVTFNFAVQNGSAVAGSDFTVPSPLTGTIAAGSTSTTISIPIIDDTVDEITSETFTVALSNATNATVSTPTATGTITDDDTASLSFDNDVTVNEGNSGTTPATFKVVLSTTSDRPITVDYTTAANTATAATDYTTTSGTLTFAPGDTEKTINVPIIGDTLDETDETFFVNLTNPTNSSITDAQAIGTITDDDIAAVFLTINPSSISEGGTATGTVTRNSSTAGPLTVTLSSSDTSAALVPGSVTILTGQSSATFTVTGVEDVVADGPQTSTITATAAGHDPATAGVTVTDNDAVALALSIAPTTISEGGNPTTATVSRNTSSNVGGVTVNISSSDTSEATVPNSVVIPSGQSSVTFQIFPAEDAIADGAQTATITVSAAGFTNATGVVTVLDNDTPGVTVSPTSGLKTSEAGLTATFTVRLNTQPTANVTIGLTSSDTTEGTVSPSSLTFTPANYNTLQTVTVTGVNDNLKDGSVSYSIITSKASSSDSNYNGEVADVSVTNDDDSDTPGLILTAVGTLSTTEAGGSASFTALLSSQPTENVSVSIVSSDATEGKVSPAALIFTPANWDQPQTVTITGVDDAVQDGNINYTITATAASQDTDFNTLAAKTVEAVNLDNDTASIIVTPVTNLVTTEAGGKATFTVKLNSQPTNNVTIPLSSSDITEGTVSPATLTFTPTNWSVAQTVTVTGVEDNLADGNIEYTILTGAAASDDRVYNNADAADVVVTNRDNDTAGVILTAPGALTTYESGQAIPTFKIVLRARPTADVYLVLRSTDLTEGKTIPENVIFTPDNWDRPQIIKVAGVNDSVVDGDQAYKIAVFRILSQNRAYNSLKVAQLGTISAVNKDDDDRTAPTLTVRTPVNGGTYGSQLTASGTASDSGLGSTGLKITGRLYRFANPATGTAAGYFAGGTSYTANYNPAFNERPATGTTNWTLALPTLTPGRYEFRARAVDGKGNTTFSPIIAFTVSDTKPVVTISTPASGSFQATLSSIAGTVVPSGRLTVSKVRVTLRRSSDGFYFNGTTFVAGNSSLAAEVSGRTYSLTEDLPSRLASGQYEISVAATDSGGNVGTATSTFRVDNQAPVSVVITTPRNGQTLDALTTIAGTVSDEENGSGIARVELIILRRSDNSYFNGSRFIQISEDAAVPSVRATLSGNNFSWTGQLPADPDAFNSFYRIQAIAYDRAGNKTSSNSVSVGITAPQVNAAQAEASKVALSIAAADAGSSAVYLTFNGAVDADSLTDAKFEVSVNGEAVTVEGASLRNTGTVVLLLADGAVARGEQVDVKWSGLRDASGKVINGQSNNVVAK